MATKRKSTKKRDPNQITAAGKPNEDQAVAIARTVCGRPFATCLSNVPTRTPKSFAF